MCEKRDSCDGLLGKYVQMVVRGRMMTAWLINEIPKKGGECIMLVDRCKLYIFGVQHLVLGFSMIQPANASDCKVSGQILFAI